MSKPTKILFITLRTFSLTGGIEKVCRGIGFALQQMQNEGNVDFLMLSLYDTETNEKYVSTSNFKGFKGNRLKGTSAAMRAGINSDIVILSHINLSPAGLAIKLLSPQTKVVLWAHGIEIWREFNWVKRQFLKAADKVVAVSRYTAGTLSEMHGVVEERILVIPNGLDPYFEVPDLEYQVPGIKYQVPSIKYQVTGTKYHDKIEEFRKRYNLKPGKKVFIALTRLKGTEKYKNYDTVIRILGALKKEGKEALYMLCGKYEEAEYNRIMHIAKESGMERNVILTGFVPDTELAAHYLLADAFVLPSTKEGFGIAFIEAQACGLFVLAGNQDGSTEAVKNEYAGVLCNPADEHQLHNELDKLITNPGKTTAGTSIQKQALEHFSFPVFQQNIQQLIHHYAN